MRPLRLMFIAGEPSGDMLGAELIYALKRSHPPGVECFGAGGAKMVSAGLRLDLDLAKHAVVGIWEVLKNYGKFKGFFDQLVALTQKEEPDAVVLIDYPGFNLRFAKKIREVFSDPAYCPSSRIYSEGGGPKIVYYVSPQVWAWHESRVHQIARDVDLLLSIFPFEKEWYYKRAPRLRVEFVGHPLIDRYAQVARPVSPNPRPLVTLLPGSRVRELRKHLPAMLQAAELLVREGNPEIKLIVPNESLLDLAAQIMGEASSSLPRSILQVGGLAETLARTDAAIASSGTVTMECAYFGVPTVVLYVTSWSTYALGKRFIKTKYLAMPNLLANKAIYPEFIQHDATGQNLGTAALALLKDESQRAAVQGELAKVIDSLGGPGASSRAARAVLSLFSLRTAPK